MGGLLQRFDLDLGLLPFYELSGLFQKGIRFRTADDERWHVELGQSAPDVHITPDTGQVNADFPFGAITKLITASVLLTGDAFNISTQGIRRPYT